MPDEESERIDKKQMWVMLTSVFCLFDLIVIISGLRYPYDLVIDRTVAFGAVVDDTDDIRTVIQ